MKFRPAILKPLNAYKRLSVAKTFGMVGLGQVGDAHAQSASSSFHLKISSYRHVGITECWKA
jgi:phosphoglycerate dehydrogenase-like enzyme